MTSCTCSCMYLKVPYSRKLSREKTFTKFAIFQPSAKVFSRNSRHATPIMRPVLAFRESFLRKMLLFYRSVKVFSLENFPLYGIIMELTLFPCRINITTISLHSIRTELLNSGKATFLVSPSPTFHLNYIHVHIFILQP